MVTAPFTWANQWELLRQGSIITSASVILPEPQQGLLSVFAPTVI